MYHIVYSIFWLFSLLPFRILYLFSDGIYLLIYYLFKYRRDLVLNNLLIAFPEKTDSERNKIAKQFYRNLIDTFVESIKFISISKKQIEKHATVDFELIHQLTEKGSNIHIMGGHQFNWEYGNALFAMNLKIPFVGIYMPIQNKYLEKIFFNFRSKYGTVLISATDFKTNAYDVFSKQYTLGLVADQNPGVPSNAYWMNFFGKPAPFISGPGKGAVKNNTAVVIVGFSKIKRGYYHFAPILITENGALFTPEQLTVSYKNELEKIIRKDPANYLWSHRRWKYDWKPEYGEVIQ